MTMAPLRFVAVTAAGVLTWMTQARRSPERDLVELLMACDADQGIDLRVLAHSLSLTMSELGRILFALNREGGLLVGLSAPVSEEELSSRRLASLQKDLQAMVGGDQMAMLVDQDGLCITAVGWPVARASQLAAGDRLGSDVPEVQAVLYFLNETVTVLASKDISPRHPVWPGLVRRLLPSCGAMSGLDWRAQ